MPKVVRVDLSRKQYAQLTILVPDDFDPLGKHGTRLLHHRYQPLLTAIAAELDSEWEEPYGEPVEVEGVELLTGDEAAQELRDYRHVDVSDRLRALEMEKPPCSNASNAPLPTPASVAPANGS